MKHLVFYKTTDVFAAEELLQNEGVEVSIAPTPVQDKAYCGVCVKIHDESLERAQELLSQLDYQLVD